MKKIIKIIFLTLIFCLLFIVSSFAKTNYVIDEKTYEYTGKEVSVKYNNENITFDVSPVIYNDRTLLPIRALVEKAGGTIDWEQKTRLITIKLDDIKITMNIGNKKASVNGKLVDLDVAPCIAYEGNDANAGRTIVPIRFVMENLGLEVDWDQKTYTVLVKDTKIEEEEPEFEFTNTVDNVTYSITTDRIVVKIVTSKPMEYTVSNYTNPDRTVIDIKGAEFKCSTKEKSVNKDVVEKIRMGQGKEYARIVVDCSKKPTYTQVTNTAKTELTITYRMEREKKTENSKFIIVLDPGHAAGTVGAYYGGVKEEEITADVVNRVLKLFEKNKDIEVYSTQKDQKIPGLKDIANYANNLDADLFISVHCNAITDSDGNPIEDITGTETFYAIRNITIDDETVIDTDKEYYGITSKKLAEIIQKNVTKTCSSNDRSAKERGTLAVLKYTNMPACLCELEFMSSTEILEKFKTDEYRDKCAQGIYNGIIEAVEYMKK